LDADHPENGVLIPCRFTLAADVGFVGLDRLAFAAKLPVVGRPHRLADAVRHEPRRFVGDAEHTVDLMGAHALLA